jgi:hypothetical protein
VRSREQRLDGVGWVTHGRCQGAWPSERWLLTGGGGVESLLDLKATLGMLYFTI